MNRPASRSWFRVALATAVFVAIVVVQFRLVSWSLSFMIKGASALGSIPISDVATLVMILIPVMNAIFIADGRHGFVWYTLIAALPSDMRRLFVIFNYALLIAMSVGQAGAVYMAGRIPADAVAVGGNITAPLDLVPGLSFAIGAPILTALGCLLPICMLLSVFFLMSQINGPHARTASGSQRGSTVPRL